MVWMYLIVQAVGLGIIAWTFSTEDKDEYAVLFGTGGFLSLCLVLAVAPLPVRLLMGFLMVRFRSRFNHTFSGGPEAILSFFRPLIALAFNHFEPNSRLMPEPLTRFLAHRLFSWRQEQRRTNIRRPNISIIGVEAREVIHGV